MANTEILNAKRLAESLGRHQQFVTAMKRAGYAFKYGRMTTREHALEWLANNTDFIATHFLAPLKDGSPLKP
jgi:hypothetical protein